MTISANKIEWLRRKRWKKEKKKREWGRLKRKNAVLPGFSSLLRFARSSFRGNDVSFRNGQDWVVQLPENFCLISNPAETLNILYSIVQISGKIRSDERLFIDQFKCKRIDIAASGLLDVLTSEVRREARCGVGGQLPNDKRACDLVQCMGITKHLQVSSVQPRPDVDETFTKLPLTKGKRSRSFGTDQERASTQLGFYLNECVKKVSGLVLSDEIKAAIVQWAGEIITNAEEHSGRNEWFSIGYMVPTAEGEPDEIVGECQLAIFGFGRSIVESINNPTTVRDETYNEMADLAAKHSKKKLFSAKFELGELLTLYSLQDGVSRFSAPTRGTGTIQFIEAFQEFGANADQSKRPEMALISGKSRILFDGEYKLKDRVVNGLPRKVIAFNETNDLEDRPDEKNVHSLDNGFPGTILTCRFFVDKTSLTKLSDPLTGTINRLSQ